MKTEKQRIGQIGEDLACKYLEKRGFKVVLRNYRKFFGEIDIISTKLEKVFFVEVKTVTREKELTSKDHFRPEDNIHPWKIKRLLKTAEAYLVENNFLDKEWQIDAIAVYLNTNNKTAKIERTENIMS